MKIRITIVAALLNFICLGLFAQTPPLVYNAENTGAAFPAPPLPTLSQAPVIDPLTDPFMWSDGSGRSLNFNDWKKRRNEIRAEVEHYEIGLKPTRPADMTATWIPNANPLTGTLRVIITINGKTLTLNSAVTLPSGSGPFPAVIGMNSQNGSIPLDIFSSRNIARITFSHNQVTTYGNPQISNPYYQLYPDQTLSNAGQYSAWAWGVSRIIDGLELVQSSLPIDLTHIGVTGCSYAGKMALFAGAFDERIALTIAQESGGGGAPAWRASEFGGDVEKLGATDYRWFKDDMAQYAGLNVSKLPHDHHELMAMIAPRALLVTGNTDFFWLSNPSCYISARAAHEVWKQYGIGDRFGFYIDGGHGHCAIPTSQRPSIEAFVEKFLKGNTTVNTNVTVHPYGDLNYQRWYSWWGTGNPVFPDEASSIKLWLETECGTVGSNWNILQDPAASKGAYVQIKPGIANSTGTAPANTAANQVVIPFNIEVAGTYNFLGRAIGPSPTEDSYWVKVDNGTFVSANGLTSSTWQWGRMAIAELAPGPHTFTITYREVGARLDKILITTSNRSIISPEILGPNCGVAPVINSASIPIDAGICNQLGSLAASDADDIAFPNSTVLQNWKIVSGNDAGIFALDHSTGQLSIANPFAIDFSKTSYTLKVTVSDGYFISNEKDIVIAIPNKIRVCHKNKNVISIGKRDVPDHLGHGDCIGSCEPATVSGRSTLVGEVGEANPILVYPNPAKGMVNIAFGENHQRITTVKMYDLAGKLVKQVQVNGKSNLSFTTDNVLPGIYLLKMQGDKVITEKVLIQ